MLDREEDQDLSQEQEDTPDQDLVIEDMVTEEIENIGIEFIYFYV